MQQFMRGYFVDLTYRQKTEQGIAQLYMLSASCTVLLDFKLSLFPHDKQNSVHFKPFNL